MAKKQNPLESHGLGKEKALDLLRQMWEIRLFEERVYDLLGTGTLELGPRSSVALDVNCWNAIIGSQSKIKGPLVAHGDVTILDHAFVHSVKAGGKVILRTGVHVGASRPRISLKYSRVVR